MALTSPTAALVNLGDGAGATQALGQGATGLFTPGGTLNFSLQSTAGLQSWDLTINAPGTKIDGQRYSWKQGQANLISIPAPPGPPFAGLLYGFTSVVSDGVQSIVQAQGYLQSIGAVGVPNVHTADVTTAAALPAYTNVSGVLTANANGALGTIDGVTPTVGMRVLVNALGATSGTSPNVDPGIYQVTSLGGASAPWIMTRAGDMAQGAIMAPGMTVEVNQGTTWASSTWKATLAGANTVGTSAPAFYPRVHRGNSTLSGGTLGLTALWLLSATASAFSATDTTATAAAANVTSPVAGAGTGTATLKGTSTDTVSWVITNW